MPVTSPPSAAIPSVRFRLPTLRQDESLFVASSGRACVRSSRLSDVRSRDSSPCSEVCMEKRGTNQFGNYTLHRYNEEDEGYEESVSSYRLLRHDEEEAGRPQMVGEL